MAIIKIPADSNGAQQGGVSPPAEPKQEEKKPRERKAIHPGLESSQQCRKCGHFVVFQEMNLEHSGFVMRPFEEMFVAFCDCGLWTKDQRGQIRWIRYSSGPVEIGGGEVYAP